MGKFSITYEKVVVAQAELSKYLRPSPLIYSAWLSDSLGCELYLKLENMQPIGSFKIRGATYKISTLSSQEKKRGVIAASAGNHAQGVAWGSKKLGVDSLIVMPTTAPLVKIQNTKALGAEIVLYGNNYDEAYEMALKTAKKTKRVLIHAFEDSTIIAGQGTVGLEIVDQLPDADYIVCSVGGGGLMTGVSTVFRALRPQTRLVGCQAQNVPSMIQSIRKGKVVTLPEPSAGTFADGIAVIHASEKVRKILASGVDEWIGVDEDSIAAAVLTLLEKAKIVAEGSGAITLAALEKIRKKIRKKKVVLVVSGGNIDVNVLSRIIDVGLIRAGRRVRLNVLIADRPGSLARLTDLIGKQGSNILQAIHDRNKPTTKFNQTEVELTLETRGPEHSASLIKAIENLISL